MRILAISPAADHTNVALYENYSHQWTETQSYDASELSAFPDIISQEEFRLGKLKELLDSKGERLNNIQAFVATGGLLHPVESGTYQINIDMLQDLSSAKYGECPANLGAPLAMRLANIAGSRYAYVVDPPSVDDMSEFAHMTGIPEVSRWSVFHALNQRAVAQREAKSLGKKIADCNFVVCHFDDVMSIGAHSGGRVVDVNDLGNGSGAMSMRQSGDMPPVALIDLCFSGRFSYAELRDRAFWSGGLAAHLGTDNIDEIIEHVKSGDRKWALGLNAYLHNITKQIGACAAVLRGKVDSIILTGSMAMSDYFCEQISQRVSWIAPVVAYPGEDDLLALVESTIRVMLGAENAKTYG
ncbi:MAG: butyrate kinase [Synergistaceae bacterium]|nr:butyrate kinase [Synergistaceae bacterium]